MQNQYCIKLATHLMFLQLRERCIRAKVVGGVYTNGIDTDLLVLLLLDFYIPN
jgi:hypothetical protein